MDEDTQTIKNLGLFLIGIGGLIFVLGIVAYLIIKGPYKYNYNE